VLFFIALFNAMDRQILAVLLEPIREEFGASGTTMGLLNGLAFSFYALAVLPIARLADLRPRRAIIAGGLFFWSMMTSASGFVRSFGQLAAARIGVGVGVGEAAFIPAAMSITSDYSRPGAEPWPSPC
jgi:MFS family permease